MTGEIGFTTNHSDLSTATSVLDGARSLLGSFFSQGADVAQRAESAAWEKAGDEAFKKASEEIRAKFVQCPRCSAWMCREQCWNEKKGALQAVRPGPRRRDGGRQVGRGGMGARQDGRGGQAPHRVRLALGHHRLLPELRRGAGDQRQVLRRVRRRPQSRKALTQCAAKLHPGAKFCAECGTKAD